MDENQDLKPNNTPQMIYIAHPVGGDVSENLRRIVEICSKVHSSQIIPLVPYYIALQYLDDSKPDDRIIGFAQNKLYFTRRIIDEVWLCGPRISSGMHEEIIWALENEIPVKCHNPALRSELAAILKEARKK
jgi:hypothetical protein